MKRWEWASPTSTAEAARRAGGRHHYNNQRAFLAMRRRGQVLDLIGVYGFFGGAQTRIAAALGVSKATISRDFRYLLSLDRCKTCGRPRIRRPIPDDLGLALAEVGV